MIILNEVLQWVFILGGVYAYLGLRELALAEREAVHRLVGLTEKITDKITKEKSNDKSD